MKAVYRTLRRRLFPSPLAKARHRGFEGDEYLAREVQKLIERWQLQVIVETGTKRAATTARLANMAGAVYTIEHNQDFLPAIERRLRKYPSVKVLLGDSAEQLSTEILPSLDQPALFYLDAHNGPESATLQKELDALATWPLAVSSAYVIHDVRVPSKDFGHNGYRYEDLEPKITKMIPRHHHYYNQQVAGAARGVLFIEPDKSA